MPFRSTKGIVTNDGDPAVEADVIMTAAALGFAGSYIATTKNPIQFDIDPLVAESDREWTSLFKATVQKLDAAVGAYLKTLARAYHQLEKNGGVVMSLPCDVRCGKRSMGWWPG